MLWVAVVMARAFKVTLRPTTRITEGAITVPGRAIAPMGRAIARIGGAIARIGRAIEVVARAIALIARAIAVAGRAIAIASDVKYSCNACNPIAWDCGHACTNFDSDRSRCRCNGKASNRGCMGLQALLQRQQPRLLRLRVGLLRLQSRLLALKTLFRHARSFRKGLSSRLVELIDVHTMRRLDANGRG
jgi:hypothetical protein